MNEFYTKVAGVTFEGRQRYIRHMQVGEKLTLERDRYNAYDSNAIRIYNESGENIGFIPRDIAAQMAPKMDGGINYTVVCSAITGNNPGDNLGVNIKVIENARRNIISYDSIKTKFRFVIYTSGNQDVFSVRVTSYINNKPSCDAIVMGIDTDKQKTSFEVEFVGKIDSILVSFEEHQEFRDYRFKVDTSQLGQLFGIRFDEKPYLYDTPTYAGGYTFLHPTFESECIDYSSIQVNTNPFIDNYI